MASDDLESTVSQFASLYSQLRLTGGVPEALSPVKLKAVLDGEPDEKVKVTALAKHIAFHSMLTLDYATPLVNAAVMGSTSNADTAQKVSTAVSGLTGSADLELSNPNPLSKIIRTVFAAVLVAVLIVALVLIAVAHSSGTAEYVGLGILGGVSWLGAVLFVMGYQNVTVKGSTGA